MPGSVTYSQLPGTQPPDPRYDLGEGARGAGGFFGNLLGQRILTHRLADQLNPMREALLQQGANVQNPTAQQSMILAAAQDPRTFAQLAGSQAGALELGKTIGGQPHTREVVVHADDDLNGKLGLNLKTGEAATITLNYDANDHRLPGFKLEQFHPVSSSGSGSSNDSSAMREVAELERRRIAEGGQPFTAAEYDRELNARHQTTKSAQEYNLARRQWIDEGKDPAQFPDFSQWTPDFAASNKIAEVGADYAARGLDDLKKKAYDAQSKLESIQVGSQLLTSGAMQTGSTANQRTALGRAFDTLLGRQVQDSASAYTDAYIANAGRLVGQTIRLFGAGTGLSDADREFAKLISGADVSMTPQALQLILEIQSRGSLGEIKRYNDALGQLSKTYPTIGLLNEPMALQPYQQGALQPIPKDQAAKMTPQEKIDYYLAQRPSYAPPPASPTPGNPQMPPSAGAASGAPALQPYQDSQKEARYQQWLREQQNAGSK